MSDEQVAALTAFPHPRRTVSASGLIYEVGGEWPNLPPPFHQIGGTVKSLEERPPNFHQGLRRRIVATLTPDEPTARKLRDNVLEITIFDPVEVMYFAPQEVLDRLRAAQEKGAALGTDEEEEDEEEEDEGSDLLHPCRTLCARGPHRHATTGLQGP